MFYWLDKYPARRASVLPLPPLSVFLPLFFLSLTSSYPFFFSKPFFVLLSFFRPSLFKKERKQRQKAKRKTTVFLPSFRPALFLPFLPLFCSSSERRKDVNKVLSSFTSFLVFSCSVLRRICHRILFGFACHQTVI